MWTPVSHKEGQLVIACLDQDVYHPQHHDKCSCKLWRQKSLEFLSKVMVKFSHICGDQGALEVCLPTCLSSHCKHGNINLAMHMVPVQAFHACSVVWIFIWQAKEYACQGVDYVMIHPLKVVGETIKEGYTVWYTGLLESKLKGGYMGQPAMDQCIDVCCV